MDVRGLIKLASGTERGEGKRGECGKQTRVRLRQKHEDSTFVNFDSDKSLMPGTKYELDSLPDSH